MKIQDLLNVYAQSPQVGALAETLRKKSVKNIFLEGLMCSSAPMLFASLSARQSSRTARQSLLTTAFVLQDADEAGYFYHDLVQLLGEGGVSFFPSSYRRAVKYGQRDAASEILRTQVLSQLASHSSSLTSHLYIVTYPEALAEQVVSKKQLDDHMLVLRQGDVVDVEKTLEVLRQMGLHEVDYVYEPGQFALRGSILDVYSYSSELPFRIDFFGDDIDSIRTFEVDTQLSKDKREQVEIVPELAVVEEKVSLLSFLPSDAVLVVKDFLYVHDAIGRTYDEGFSAQALKERMEEATEVEQQTILEEMSKEAQLMTASQFMHEASAFRRIEVGTHATGVPDATITFHTSPQPQFHKNFDLLQQSLEQSLAGGYRLCILADSPKQLERLRDIFAEKGSVSFDPVERTLHAGFVDHDLKLCVFTDHQIFDRFHKYNLRSDKARGGKVALTLKEIQQFEIGDYVVHIDHGIGKFGGLVRMPQGTGYQEMIKIQYDGGGTIYVSIHSLYKVSKYKAQDGGEPPRLSHLGTGQWERMKERTKQKLKDIARDLIQLYAARRQQRGFAFSADSFMQHELEASFLYEDTPDQLKATNDVKADMERPQPMDRLVCGDVGFGKTEIALRAACLAALNGKQTAVLAPTTLLAEQHFETFSERFSETGATVEVLSRFKTAKQSKEILEKLEAGTIDVIIGTHKLLSSKIKFKDLGLLIVDEEHRFGVRQKEKIKSMRADIDILTLTATPIPRTLNLAFSGLRDLSIIATPPAGRLSIKTLIRHDDDHIIKEAVLRELNRGGQVYFLHNDIKTIAAAAERLQNLVPQAKIRFAHGRMEKSGLETTMNDFYRRRFNVLVCTSIIETGLDIPTANTIIIERADKFGLAQLHQIRGRVGRSKHQAYAYLLVPEETELDRDAKARLRAIESSDELGAGFSLATSDLEIRGAGELLGEEQSGQITTVGFDLYMDMLENAVKFLKEGREPDENALVSEHAEVDIGFPALIPENYVNDVSTRLRFYKRIAGTSTRDETDSVISELGDRFGKIPEEVMTLGKVTVIRQEAEKLGIVRLRATKEGGLMEFNDHPSIKPEKIIAMIKSEPYFYKMEGPNKIRYKIPGEDIATRVKAVESVMRKMA